MPIIDLQRETRDGFSLGRAIIEGFGSALQGIGVGLRKTGGFQFRRRGDRIADHEVGQARLAQGPDVAQPGGDDRTQQEDGDPGQRHDRREEPARSFMRLAMRPLGSVQRAR